MKKIVLILIAAALVFGLAACGSQPENKDTNITANDTVPANSAADNNGNTVPANNTDEPSKDDQPAGKNVLVVYFSATGTTKRVAEKIAEITGADIYEIKAAQEYTTADLNWNDRSSRSTKEQNDKSARPQIGSDKIDITGYKTIYIGFPIWWGEEPRIMDTFVESYSFEGITLVPFCTSSSSGIGRSGPNMEALAKSGTWLNGKRFAGNVSDADLKSWIDGLK
ncbi:MAG: flavodoxin [Firmicutes bacterium]|nr:flavodoxin [Bacillota bacterium]